MAVLLGALLATVARAQPAPSQEPEPQQPPREIAELELESLLELPVVSSTKEEQRGAQTPAVVSVISGEEARNRGCTTLAEALLYIPGLYDVYDLVTHNMGIRGINGGIRASGNILLLLIDGYPVDYRPTTGNSFGEELIPLELVERVEVIRGPASALYGPNAFLGVVNVITRGGEELEGLRLVGHGGTVRLHPAGGGGLVVGGAEGSLELALGLSAFRLDRSGLGLPSSSPVLQEPLSPVPSRAPSRDDIARPKSFFGRATVGTTGTGRVQLLASLQNLDSASEFNELAALTHGTRVAALNQNYRLAYLLEPSEKVALELTGFFLHGAPTGAGQLDTGRPDYVFIPEAGVVGFGGSAEGRWAVHPTLALTGGVDFVHENHLLRHWDRLLIADVLAPDGTVLSPAGTLIPGEGHDQHRVFRNLGVFAQGHFAWSEAWSAIVGGRLDVQNIYGTYPSFRAGLVYAPPKRAVSAKLLYGSSFKAPSAEQLFTQPATFLDIQGNPDLKPQTAHTFELAGALGVAEL